VSGWWRGGGIVPGPDDQTGGVYIKMGGEGRPWEGRKWKTEAAGADRGREILAG